VNKNTSIILTTITMRDGKFIEESREISYDEAIQMEESYFNYLNRMYPQGEKVPEGMQDKIEVLQYIIYLRMNKIIQDHCE
jgi:hypothetical protein